MTTQTEFIERNLDVTRIGCKFNRVKAIEQQSFRGHAVRAITNGKLGHTSTTDNLSEDQLIKRAVDTAQVDAPRAFSFPTAMSSGEPPDPALNHMTDRELRDMAKHIIRTIRRDRSDIAVELELRRVRETIDLHNSNGGAAHFVHVWLEGEAWVERHTGDDVLVALDRFATARADDAHLEFARRMARRLRWAGNPIEPKAGSQSVIFSPSAFASLLDPMLFALNGAHALQSNSRGSKRRSGFASQIGRQVFDAQFSVYDDATLPDRPHSAPVDHEGTPAQCTALVKAGIVSALYHDLMSAVQAETHSTGNGYRALIDPPRPSPTNVRVAGGSTSLSDMLKQLDDGLLIDLIGESDSSIGLSGDFSRTIVLAYQIKHGHVAGFVRGASVSGDLYQSLQKIEALSCDGYWSSDIFTPYIQLSGVRIST